MNQASSVRTDDFAATWESLWSSRDLGRILALFTQDARYFNRDLPREAIGTERLRETFSWLLHQCDAHLRIESREDHGDDVLLRWTRQASRAFGSSPALHNPILFGGWSRLRLTAGKIHACEEHWGLAEIAGMAPAELQAVPPLRQLDIRILDNEIIIGNLHVPKNNSRLEPDT